MSTGSGVPRASWRLALAAGAVVLASSSLAQAQFFGFRYGYDEPHSYWSSPYRRPPVVLEELRPGEIVAALEARGFSRISRPVYDEDTAVVRAVSPAGRPVRLTIDIFSGRIIDREVEPRERPPQVVQRAPDQGPAIRRTVPEPTAPARAAPVERPPAAPREPVTPRAVAPPAPPRNDRIVRPEKPAQPAQPPQALGTKQQPRRIEISPPAPLDAPPAPAQRPAEAPINSVPPAALE